MPNSILWIGLVVLWVFVLFPMLANRHPRIRQHTDAALSTRVLHRGGAERSAKKGPATGHDTDPDYVPVRRKLQHPSEDPEDRMTRSDDSVAASDEKEVDTEVLAGEAQATTEVAEPEADSTETVGEPQESTESESGTSEPEPVAAEATADEPDPEPRAAQRVRIPALLEPDPEPAPEPESDSDDEDFVPTRRGRGGFDPEADAAARAARYTFRQRAVLGLVLSTLILAAAGFAIASLLWVLCALSAMVLVGYLGYLRRQVRIEADIRRRRAARAVRKRLDAEDEAPARDRPRPDREQTRTQLRRAVLVEPDDEDPLFEHLELFDAAEARATRQRATGGRERRAVGE